MSGCTKGSSHGRCPAGYILPAALLLACTCAVAQESLPDIPAQVFDLRSPTQGSSWIALSWDSTAMKHDICWGEIKGHNVHALRFATIRGIYTLAFSVMGLKPATRYEFYVRAYPVRGGPPVDSQPLVAETRPAGPREVAGLRFWPQRPLGTFRKARTEACVEAYQGKLYVLEVVECKLYLSCVNPGDFKVEWTQEVTPAIDEEALCYLDPDTCIHEDRLWITWCVQHRDADPASPSSYRQRLMYFDLSAVQEGAEPEKPEELVSAVMEIVPTEPGRGTRKGTVSAYLGGLWLSWLEEWEDEKGQTHAEPMLAPYEAWRGQLGMPVRWRDCPVDRLQSFSIANFGGRLVILFSGPATNEAFAGSEYLWFAQFDGKRFYDVRTIRRLGTNRNGRGVQLYERFYFVYDTDADYLGSMGAFRDIAVGRLVPFQRFGGATQGYIAALPYVADMKYNSSPDITTLGDAMYTVCSKREQPPVLEADAYSAAYGTYIGRITRTVTESLSEF